MFIVAQYLLSNNFHSITSGIIFYTVIYVYALTQNDSILILLNKLLPYVLAIDLIVSTFFVYSRRVKQMDVVKQNEQSEPEFPEVPEPESQEVQSEPEAEPEPGKSIEISEIPIKPKRKQGRKKKLKVEELPNELPKIEELPNELPKIEELPNELDVHA